MVTDEDGNVKTPPGTRGVGLYVLETIKYGCMLGMYGGATGIVYGLFDMTVANANGKGSLFSGSSWR